jgi:hypothetical protein
MSDQILTDEEAMEFWVEEARSECAHDDPFAQALAELITRCGGPCDMATDEIATVASRLVDKVIVPVAISSKLGFAVARQPTAIAEILATFEAGALYEDPR